MEAEQKIEKLTEIEVYLRSMVWGQDHSFSPIAYLHNNVKALVLKYWIGSTNNHL